MQYSISNWIYAMEDLEKSLQRLAKYKYNAVELEGEPDKEKLNFLSRNFDGRIICCSNLRWLTHDIVDINYWEVDFYLPKGIEFWHLEENLPTGWGVIRDHKGRLIFIENKSLKKRPTKVYNNIWAQLILSQTKKSPFKYLKYGLNRYYATTAKEE